MTVDGVDLGIYVGCGFVEAMAFAGGRAYTFTIESSDAQSRATYQQMLRSIVFDPASADDSPALAPDRFVSARHGYSIRYPRFWRVVAATEPWPYGTGIPGGRPSIGNLAALDQFMSGGSEHTVGVTSQRLPDGVTAIEWRDEYHAWTPKILPGCLPPPPEQWERLTVDGVDLDVYAAFGFIEAIAFAGGRAYTFTLEAPFDDGATTRAAYEQTLQTIVFDPASANDSDVEPSPLP